MKGSNRKISFPDFIHLFDTPSIAQTHTSENIPEQLYNVSSMAKHLFSKNYPMGFVLVLAKSEWVRTCARSMVLQLFHWEEQCIENNGIMIYSKCQLAYNESAQPYHWVYCEQSKDCFQRWVQMFGSLCFAVLIQDESVQRYKELIGRIKKWSKQLSGSIPKFYVLSQTDQPADEGSQLQYIAVGKSTKIDEADPQFIQSLFQNGKNILSHGKPFVYSKRQVSSSVIPYFLNSWENKITNTSSPSSYSIDSIFQKSIQAYEEKIVDDAFATYKSKMGKLRDEKKALPLKTIKSTHEMGVQYIIKSIQKDMCFNENLQEKLCSAINEQLKNIYEEANDRNYEWGKQFLHQEFNSINQRLKSMQIKNTLALKQEIMIFRDFFHKKTEHLNCKKLDLYFQQFVILKLTQCCQSLLQGQKKDLTHQAQELRLRLSQLQNEKREQRKILTKNKSENQTAMQSLVEKLSYYCNREQILQANIKQLKNELSQCQSRYDEKIQELQNKFLCQCNSNRKDYFKVCEEMGEKKRQIIVLQSEIEKEKLLHQQSKNHYESIIKKQKQRQQLLEYKIEQLNAHNLEQLEQIKRRSEKSISQSTTNKGNYQREYQRVLADLKQMQEEYEKLDQRYRTLQYSIQIKENQSQLTHNEMEIALKKSQQKCLELESRIPRFMKYETDYLNLQKIVDQLTKLRKDAEKQNALITQECLFLNETIAGLETKAATLKAENTQLKQSIENLEENRVKQAVKTDEWVQTDLQSRQEQQLKEALKLTQILEQEYTKLKRQMAKQSKGNPNFYS